MSLPQMIPESAIIDMETRARVANQFVLTNEHWREGQILKRARQRQWLESFKNTLSPAMAGKKTDTPMDTYRAWRKNDPMFCKMFNEAMQQVLEELQGSVLVRAMGSAVTNEEGELATDAAGRPIYQNGSDRLAIALLGLEKKEQSTDVVVNIEIISREG